MDGAMGVDAALRELRAMDVTKGIGDDLLSLYREHDSLHAVDCASMLGLSRPTVTKRINVLRRHHLVRWTRHGWKAAPSLLAYVRGG